MNRQQRRSDKPVSLKYSIGAEWSLIWAGKARDVTLRALNAQPRQRIHLKVDDGVAQHWEPVAEGPLGVTLDKGKALYARTSGDPVEVKLLNQRIIL